MNNRFNTTNKEPIEEYLKSLSFHNEEDRNMILMTGKQGGWEFDIVLQIGICRDYRDNPFEALAEKYRESRLELFKLREEYTRIKNNWWVKLLFKLKLIK